MIHTHKRSLMKSKKKKEEEAEQGVNYLSQEKQKEEETMETLRNQPFIIHKHTHL